MATKKTQPPKKPQPKASTKPAAAPPRALDPSALTGAAAATWEKHSSLVLWKDNPRKNEPVVARVVESLIQFGWGRALVARAANRELCVGHTTWKAAGTLAAELAKDEALPVKDRRTWHSEALRTAREGLVPVRLKDMTAEQSHQLARADNRLGEFAEWDNAKAFAQLEEDGALLAALQGWNAEDMALLKRALAGDTFNAGGSTATAGSLAADYGEPPFSVLDTRSGRWQARKREWLGLGIQSEVGRGDNLLNYSSQMLEAGGRRKKKTGKGRVGPPGTLPAGLAFGKMTPYDGANRTITGTSVFDPVLCELSYAWYTGEGAKVLDPFAGGSVRGLVCAALGRKYTGLELRGEQVLANRQQWKDVGKKLKKDVPAPDWREGEAFATLKNMGAREFDFVFSCPPYMDLEKYSQDPRDLSTLKPDEFEKAYSAIIAEAVRCLKDDRFACFVVSEVRAPRPGFYRQLPAITVRAFEAAGARYYNEVILVNAVSSLPLRMRKQFDSGRKVGRTHQNVLVFCKGDPEKATKACGKVTRVLWTDEAAPAPDDASRTEATEAADAGKLAANR